MQIEEGKFYRTGNGAKVGPMSYNHEPYLLPWSAPGYLFGWASDGRQSTFAIPPRVGDYDLVAEWTDEQPAVSTTLAQDGETHAEGTETAADAETAPTDAGNEKDEDPVFGGTSVSLGAEVWPEGRKDDGGKDPWDLFPSDAARGIVRVLAFGRDKYGARNWEKGMAWSRCYGAMLRHAFAWWEGEDKDPETGHSHLWHAGCCLMFLIAYELRGIGSDDRPAKSRRAA